MADNAPHLPEPPAELLEHLNRGDCVLFVGDALDVPGGQSARLASALVDACNAHEACPVPACRSGRRCAQPHACAVPLTHAAQLYESQTNRQALVDFVVRHVASAGPPTPVHRALAELPVRVLVTTAYDDRLEEALRLAGRPYLQVVRDTSVPFYDPARVQVIRLHGTVSQPDSLVLTEDDAADLFAPLKAVTDVLRGHFASETLLFVGYRLSDPHFLALYNQVTRPLARYQRLAYAVQWPPDRLAADRWRGRVTMIPVEPLPFLEKLARSIRIQAVREKRAALPPEPYKFLDYFTRQDAAIFFGRDLEADLLLSTVLAHKLSVFYGRSGTGKTSLLLARVGPALEEVGYRVACARMLGDPAAEVKAAVRGLRLDQLSPADRGRSLRAVLADALPPAGRLVVILDQFEEFFLRQGEDVRQAFAQEMADCLWPTSPLAPRLQGKGSQPPSLMPGEGDWEGGLDVRFVLSLRDDYLGALDELSGLLPQDVFSYRYKLENLTREKALLAILKPAEAFGLPVEEPLRERLIADLEDQGLEPANLQVVLYRLYRDALEHGLWSPAPAAAGEGLTLARYAALGGTREILAGYLDEVLAGLAEDAELEKLPGTGVLSRPQVEALRAWPGDERQKGARVVLKSMITAQQTKAAVSGQEIARGDLAAKVGLSEAQLEALLAYLRNRRVVRKLGDEERYELAHEVMVQKVWAWVSDEELRVLNVRDMLRRELSNYVQFGHLLTREKLEIVTACGMSLATAPAELELLFRSALTAGYEVATWFERARQAGVAVDEIALAGLQDANFRARAAAVAALGQLGARFAEPIMGMLADDYPQVRAAAIHALEKLRPDGAWRERLVCECYVPAGPFVMGDDHGNSDEKPAHEVDLAAYYIGKYPVTNAEYKRYMDDLGRAFAIPSGKERHPVVSISWYDARDYAAWASMRLLTEAEWEKAASWEPGPVGAGSGAGLKGLLDKGAGKKGPAGRKRRYPWGDEFDQGRCNTSEAGIRGMTPVGRYSPQGDSPYGCADMAGNVWEWTSSLPKGYPYRAGDGHEDMGSSGSRVVRGGSFFDDASSARAAYRGDPDPYVRGGYYGVRVCLAAPFSPPSGR